MGSGGCRKKKGSGQQQTQQNALKAAENALAAAQKSLQAEADQQQRIVETNLILTELLYCAERVQAVYEKHLAWLAAGGSGGQQECRAPSRQHGQDGQDSRMLPVPLLEQRDGQRDDAHWVIYALETATWEQLQQVLAMTAADWVDRHRQCCTELYTLFDVSQRCPEVQDMMLGGINAPKLSLEGMPTAAAGFAASTSSSGSASDSGMTDAPSSTPASDILLHMMKDTANLMYVGVLHGMPAMFEASAKSLLTGEDCAAPHLHWASVAQRMRLTRLQKLHFKLALENFGRQARAAAAQGLSVLQETPSYAFLLACEAITAQQQLSSKEGSPQATSDTQAAAQQSTGNAAAAAAAGAQGLSSRAASVSHAAGSAGGMGSACGLAGTASAGTAAAGPGVAGAGAASGAGVASGSGSAGAAGEAAGAAAGPHPPAGDAAAAGGSAGQHEEAMVDADAPSCPTQEMEHQLGLYYRQVVNLNIFLSNTLTLEQLLILNIAAFPFWPHLAAVAEAAVQLLDEPEEPAAQPAQQELQGQQGIQLLMRRRRCFMQQAHYEWWRDYGCPGSLPEPE